MLFTIEPATLQDADFIISLVVAGARKGHFFPNLASDRTLLRRFVLSTTAPGLQDGSGLCSEAVVGRLGNERVGCVIITETERNDNSIEIGVVAIKKQYQGAGYGGKMLDAVLGYWLPRKTVYARCFPASEALCQMLLRRSFTVAGTMARGTRILKREQEHPPVQASAAALRLTIPKLHSVAAEAHDNL